MLSNEELFIVLGRQMNFDSDQKNKNVAAIDCLVTCAVYKHSEQTKGTVSHINGKKHVTSWLLFIFVSLEQNCLGENIKKRVKVRLYL